MDYDALKPTAEFWSYAASTAAVAVGGLWVFFRFILQKEHHAKIQFDVDLNFIAARGDRILVEVTAKIENRGLVRHSIRNLYFDLLYLPKDATLQKGNEEINYQVKMIKLEDEVNWVPEKWSGTYIDSGVAQIYTYLTSVPNDALVVSVLGRFQYPGWKKDFHTAQKTRSLPQNLSQSDQRK